MLDNNKKHLLNVVSIIEYSSDNCSTYFSFFSLKFKDGHTASEPDI